MGYCSYLLLSSAEMFYKPLRQTVWTQSRGCSYKGAALSGSIFKLLLYLNLSITFSNYLQQTTSAGIFRYIFVDDLRGSYLKNENVLLCIVQSYLHVFEAVQQNLYWQ